MRRRETGSGLPRGGRFLGEVFRSRLPGVYTTDWKWPVRLRGVMVGEDVHVVALAPDGRRLGMWVDGKLVLEGDEPMGYDEMPGKACPRACCVLERGHEEFCQDERQMFFVPAGGVAPRPPVAVSTWREFYCAPAEARVAFLEFFDRSLEEFRAANRREHPYPAERPQLGDVRVRIEITQDVLPPAKDPSEAK
jgi:hypothetical protein